MNFLIRRALCKILWILNRLINIVIGCMRKVKFTLCFMGNVSEWVSENFLYIMVMSKMHFFDLRLQTCFKFHENELLKFNSNAFLLVTNLNSDSNRKTDNFEMSTVKQL